MFVLASAPQNVGRLPTDANWVRPEMVIIQTAKKLRIAECFHMNAIRNSEMALETKNKMV